MFTFITIVTTSHPVMRLGTPVEVFRRETRALTWEQAEKQALVNADLTVRDGLGRIVESPELTIKTIRKP